MITTLQKNQYLINTSLEIIFQSYNTIIFTYYKHDNKIVFNTDEDNYTKTTCKYLVKALYELDELTNFKHSEINNLRLKSKNRKKDILALKDGVLYLC